MVVDRGARKAGKAEQGKCLAWRRSVSGHLSEGSKRRRRKQPIRFCSWSLQELQERCGIHRKDNLRSAQALGERRKVQVQIRRRGGVFAGDCYEAGN
jgi:hypothetical protein